MSAAANGDNKSSSLSITIQVIVIVVAVVVGIVFVVVAFSLSHSDNKGEAGGASAGEEEEGGASGSSSGGGWALIAIKSFDYENIKVGQPIPSFTVEVASGNGAKFCNKPDVYIGKVSTNSSSTITPMGATYDFTIPVEGRLIASCTLRDGNYTTTWIANNTSSSSSNSTSIILRDAGIYDIVADAQLRHPSIKRFDVIE